MAQRLRVIQGGVLPAELRALVLARDAAAPPSVTVTEVASGKQVPCAVRVGAPAGSLLAPGLAARKLQALHVVASGLQSATRYRVTASTASAREAVEVTTLPRALPPEGLTVAVATCYFDDYRRDGWLARALTTPHSGQLPALQIWAGDNLYLDVPPAAVADRPIAHTLDRYVRYFVDSDYARVRAIAPTLTTYDDHEYWNNYPQYVAWLTRSSDASWKGYRDAGLAATKLFQSAINPQTGGPGHYTVRIPPLELFVLDVRSFRSRDHVGPKQLLAPGALAALLDWAARLQGPGVLVLGQPLWIAAGNAFDRNVSWYTSEYQAIWRALRQAPYDVLVVSGDVHHSRVLRIGFAGAPNRFVYEFVTSPACHIPKPLSVHQDRGSLAEIPGKVEGSGQSLAAQAFFGTSAQQCIGLLRFVPQAHGEVTVGASFVDCAQDPRGRFARPEPITTVPRLGTFTECHHPKLFTLRMR